MRVACYSTYAVAINPVRASFGALGVRCNCWLSFFMLFKSVVSPRGRFVIIFFKYAHNEGSRKSD
jgi:hypothetical protein